jgi:hypothetical protein
MDVILPTMSEITHTKVLSGLRENCPIKLLFDLEVIVLWDGHNPEPTKFLHVPLEKGTVLITGSTYRDEADLYCCDLDYYHPPRLLWASDRSACYLVNGDFEVSVLVICDQE